MGLCDFDLKIMAIPSPIYQSTVDSKQRLYYKPQGSDTMTQIANPNELQSLAKQGLVEVGKGYQQYTPPSPTTGPTSPVEPTNGPSPSPTPTTGLEEKPGVFKASSLKSYYDDQINAFKPQFENATKTLSDINTQLSSLSAPDYQATYDQEYTSKVAPLDTQLNTVKGKVDQIDSALRTIEDSVRQEIGGTAPESVIQAEVARRSKPLNLERQGYVDQYNTISTQKNSLTSSIEKALGFKQQSYADQLSALDKKSTFAKNVVDQYNSLIEKGASISDKEIDNFRTMFSTLLTQSPDVLKNLTQAELDSMRSGYLPASVMSKIGETINEQKIDATEKKASETKQATASQILNRAYQIQQLESARGNEVSYEEAIKQARGEYEMLNGAGSTNDLNLSFNQSPAFQETDASKIANAIKQVESGGNYSVKGASGESGAYQFMPATWKSWAKQYLGDANAPMTQANQDKVATSKIQDLLNQGYNAQQIALIWNGGQPVVKKGVNKYGVKYDSGSYANKVLAALGGADTNTIITPSTAPEVVMQRNPTFEEYKTSVEQQVGFKLPAFAEQALRGKYNSTYNQTSETGKLPFEPQFSESSSKFTPKFYGTALGQKTLDNEANAKSKFEGNAIVKDFNSIQDQYTSMKAITDSGTGGPQDVALVYSFMKALDPTSVVRESEYDMAAQSGNLFQGWAAKYNGYLKENGGKLPENVKKEFLNIINARLKAKTEQYNNYASQTREIAKRQGLNPDNVAIQFKFNPMSATSSGTQGSTSSDSLNLGVGGTTKNPLGLEL